MNERILIVDDTPANIQEAAVAAMRRGETRYTAVDGTPALKQERRSRNLP